jgi:Arc/MetJ family transcription regulator
MCDPYTNCSMRTNIEINDQPLYQVTRSGGARTKRAAVEAGLRLLVKTHAQTAIRKLRGKVQWEGDLNASRLDRVRSSSQT